jgi:hypothetical protein
MLPLPNAAPTRNAAFTELPAFTRFLGIGIEFPLQIRRGGEICPMSKAYSF